jgi:type I restriction enzyme S subunit
MDDATKKNTFTSICAVCRRHQGLIRQRDYYTKDIASKDTSHYYLLHEGDFVYNKGWCDGYPLGAVKKLKDYKKGVVSTLYICFRLKNKNLHQDIFWEYYLQWFVKKKRVCKSLG